MNKSESGQLWTDFQCLIILFLCLIEVIMQLLFLNFPYRQIYLFIQASIILFTFQSPEKRKWEKNTCICLYIFIYNFTTDVPFITSSYISLDRTQPYGQKLAEICSSVVILPTSVVLCSSNFRLNYVDDKSRDYIPRNPLVLDVQTWLGFGQ